MIARASEEERRAGGNNAVIVLRHESYFENEHGMPPGVYTEKVFHIRQFLPRFIKYFVPESKSVLIEKVIRINTRTKMLKFGRSEQRCSSAQHTQCAAKWIIKPDSDCNFFAALVLLVVEFVSRTMPHR